MTVKIHANEFREMIKSGAIDVSGKRITTTHSYNSFSIKEKTVSKKRSVKQKNDYLTTDVINKNTEHYLSQGKIYIPYDVISSKNSKQIGFNNKTKKPTLRKSNAALKYEKISGPFYQLQKRNFLELIKDIDNPIWIGLYWIRSTNGKFDGHNMEQLPLDLMQEYKWLDDDDMDNVRVVPLGYEVDKYNAGLVIEIIKNITINGRPYR